MDQAQNPPGDQELPPGDGAQDGEQTGKSAKGGSGRWLGLGAVGLLIGSLLLLTEASAPTVVGAVVLGALILVVGVFFLRQFATPPPPPPDPGTLRRVRLTYRCPSCGAEVRMTTAATEDPEPPRHCMEDMELIKSEL
jgi:hypothetical protein